MNPLLQKLCCPVPVELPSSSRTMAPDSNSNDAARDPRSPSGTARWLLRFAAIAGGLAVGAGLLGFGTVAGYLAVALLLLLLLLPWCWT